MAGTKTGGQKAAAKNIERYGKDFYKKLGKLGGKASGTGGFAYMARTGQLDKVREAGRKGGSANRGKN